jgi:DNA-binding XRE family transcriptional regulator
MNLITIIRITQSPDCIAYQFRKKVKKTINSEKLKEARRKAHLTQVELAKRIGVTQTHISKIERGDADPAMETLDGLLRALSLRIEDVWTRASNPPLPPEAVPEPPGAERRTA